MLATSRARRRRRRSRFIDATLVIAVAGYGASCGSSAPPPAICPDDGVSACPAPAPSFAADAAPIIQSHCVKCHAPGGMAQAYPFQSYDEIAPFAGDINLQLQLCAMPPAPERPLTAAERQSLFGWIVCGALDN